MSFMNTVKARYEIVVGSLKSDSDIKKEVIRLVLTGKYPVIGIRYEAKRRSVGDICEDSKDNPERDDPRDFPSYNSEEYEDLPSMGGTSAWLIYLEDHHPITPDYDDEDDRQEIIDSLNWENLPAAAHEVSHWEHIYIVGGDKGKTREDYDENEVVIEDAKVLLVVK